MKKIDRLTTTQRIKMIKTRYKNDSATVTYRALRGNYGLHKRPTKQANGKIMKKFEETGVVTNIESPMHHCFARSAENIAAVVSENVAEDPNLSIPHRSQELGLSYCTLWRIVHLNLHLHSYKVQLTQQLKPANHSQRRRYFEWVLEQHAVDGNFSNKIFFSDEAYFTLGGYVNKQICRIWSSEDPQVIEESPLHPE